MNFRTIASAAIIASAAFSTPASAWSLSEALFGIPVQTAQHAPHGKHHRHGVARAQGGGTVLTSYYGGGGKREGLKRHTANGDVFRAGGLTAAHRTLPLGTKLLVSRGPRHVVVTVNDRGPAAWTGRSLDLSRHAAEQLGLILAGTGYVHIAVLGR